MVLPVPGIRTREGRFESRHHSSGLLLFLLDVGNLNFQLDIPPVNSVELQVDCGLSITFHLAALDVRTIQGGFFVVPAVAAFIWIQIAATVRTNAVIGH